MDACTQSLFNSAPEARDLEQKDKAIPREEVLRHHNTADSQSALSSHLLRQMAIRPLLSHGVTPIRQYEGSSATIIRILDALEEVSSKNPTPVCATD